MTNAVIVSENLKSIIASNAPIKLITYSKSNIESVGENNPDLISQAEAEAGTATTERVISAERLAQAITALASSSPEILDTLFRIVDSVSGYKQIFDTSELTADRTITTPNFDFDFNSYFDSSGNITTPILQANGTGAVQINANNLKFATFTGALLVTYNLSGFKLLRTAAISGTAFQYDSAVTDASAETAGFYINNKNVTTKKIISFESNNVEKASIDADGNLSLNGGLVCNHPAYDDDTAAGVAGLTAGQHYQTTGSGASPLNVAGIVMVKQ